MQDPKSPGWYYMSPAGWVGPFLTRWQAADSAKPYGYDRLVRQFPR